MTNAEVVERFYYQMWNRFEKSLVAEMLTEDLRFRGSLEQEKVGHREFADYVDFVQAAFPDFTNQIDELITVGTRAVARLTYRGTHLGELFGIAPTGRRVEYVGAAFFRFRGSRISEAWVLGDLYGLLRQLGAIK